MAPESERVRLDLDDTLWEKVFTVAPLVIVGTREPDGGYDLAPKHLVSPMWGLWFVFVCALNHATYRNAVRERAFTVSWVRPSQVIVASLAATHRFDDGTKPALAALHTFDASVIDGAFVRDGCFFLECELDRVVEGFGINSLVIGRVVAAHADRGALRNLDPDDAELEHPDPLLAYLSPGRFARIERSLPFPFPEGFKR
jgi:flavin reductase (DIM6/NTAB) family NADH-FMN oxidoreductase RutF